jgi:hypothetical protein
VRLVIAGQHEARRPDSPHKLAIDAVHESRLVKIAVKSVEHLRRRFGVILERRGPGLEPRRPGRRHRADPPDRLRQNRGGHALRLFLQQVQDERAADALAIQVTPIDPQMIEQRDMVFRVTVPAVLGRDRGA